MPTAVVLGGGVSGLSAAFYINRYLPLFNKVIVLEAANRVGGWIQTTQHNDGSIFEHGPRSIRPFLEPGRNTLELAEDLGLSNKILPVYKTDPAAKNRYLYVDGKLCALPNSLEGMFKTLPPFTKPLFSFIKDEPFRRRSETQDESVHSFVSRRMGDEMANLAVSAMCRGIFAGDAKKLSVQACFPILHERERRYGSLTKGSIIEACKRFSAEKPKLTGLAKRAQDEKWAQWSLTNGMQQLTDTLAEAVVNKPGTEIRLNTPGTKIIPQGKKILVQTESEKINADLVLSSIYSKDLATILPEELSDLKQDLSLLPSVTVVVVNLEYKDNVLPVSGFGHLLPPCECADILGVVYDSCAFPEHNKFGNPNTTRLTVMMGGAWYHRLTDRHYMPPSDDELVARATREVARMLGIDQEPIRSQVKVHKDCIPQYQVGHVRWVHDLETKVKATGSPLQLLGSSYRGPAVNDCINTARTAVSRLRRDTS